MNNRRKKQYYYRHNKKKKFRYYCHNNKPFFYRKKYKGLRKDDNENILLLDNNKGDIKEDVKQEQVLEDNKKELEIIFNGEEDIMLPKLPVIRIALGIVVVVAIIFGISYGYFNYYQEVSRQADITTAEVYVRVLEETTNMTLNKLYPKTDAEARAQTNNYVDFTVVGKNTSSTKVLSYTINITDGTAVANKVRISRDNIKVDLQQKVNNEYVYLQEGVSLSNFSFKDVIPINTAPNALTREYRLRLWVSDSVLISDTEEGRTYTQSEFANLYASYHVEVNSHDESLICRRATTLHTETCNQSSNHCYADGYYEGGSKNTTTITYGNASVTSGELHTGDAFDCDVNGDGIVNVDTNGNSTERFYYVSPYYDTSTKTFDNTYATLIYYSHTYNNGSSIVVSTNGAAYYASANENWHGPVTAATHLPTTTQWSNVTLKSTSRAILACSDANCSGANYPATATSGGTLPPEFSYSEYAARLLTLPELVNGCRGAINNNISLAITGSLTACNFLFEGTKYADSNKATYGPWLETPATSATAVRLAGGDTRRVYTSDTNDASYGARPAIDVPISRIQY